MTKQVPVSWMITEPGLGSTMDTLRLATIGHFAEKKDVVDTTFSFEGFALVLRGRGVFRVGDGAVQGLEAPAVFYIWPGPRFYYRPDPGTTWDERFLCFTGPRVKEWRRWGWLTRPRQPRPLIATALHAAAHERASASARSGRTGGVDEAKLETERLVWALHQEALNATMPVRDEVDEMLEAWREQPPKDTKLPDCAKAVSMSYSGFRQKVRDRTGLGPYQYLLQLRLDAACRLLIEGNDPVKSVAFSSGFPGVESFCRAFKRVKKMTPSEYRSRHAAMRPAKAG